MSMEKYKDYFLSKSFRGKATRKSPLNPDQSPIIEEKNPFNVDSYSIDLSKASRLLSKKTQVFSLTEKSYIRNRQIHTGEVVAISCQISDIIGANTSLVRAIAQGHDIGHIAFGHLGEAELTKYFGKKIHHAILGTIVLQKIERGGAGLNLSKEVLNGIHRHSFGRNRITNSGDFLIEDLIVAFSDKIAFSFADFNDFLRLGRKPSRELKQLINHFGDDQRQRYMRCINSLIKESCEKEEIDFCSSPDGIKFECLKNLLYDEIYLRENKDKYKNIINSTLNILQEFKKDIFIDPLMYFILLTDLDCLKLFKNMKRKSSAIIKIIKNFSATETAARLAENGVGLFDPTIPILL